ncbi:vWA domain-containing protein [Hymenobacter persicinus]|uniref:VWA domain-containing protein n=1 Tax=Hymenobacter persicinus TaxID=2025506 RepID=A0A4Q5LBR5_9BACT|nr:VWA domain-containing protein [Hymenobacter persicinus]RYU77162.1 VWA domain-containing protein [Hymenobacter persicinus]
MQQLWQRLLAPLVDGLRYATLSSYTWEQPRLLLLIPLIPLLFVLRWALVHRRRSRLGVAFVAGQVRRDWTSVLRFLPDLVLALSLAFGIVALARPQRTDERVVQSGEGIDILLLLDVSGSMELQDLKPNRLEAAKRVAREFIDGRVGDRIGLVVFAGDAYSLAPLTTDYDLLRENIAGLKLGMIANDGTAIGTALGVATNRLRESRSRTKVCILISDGENTAGSLDPITAARLAHAYGLKIYTIGLGKDGYVPYGTDAAGIQRYVETRLDETTMRELAQAGDGQFFRAADNAGLRRVFQRIDQYEKSEIKQTRFRNTKDYYRIYLLWAVGLWLLWLALKNTFLTNALED